MLNKLLFHLKPLFSLPSKTLTYQCPRCNHTLEGEPEKPVYCKCCDITFETWATLYPGETFYDEYGFTGKRWYGKPEDQPQ